MFIKRVLSQHRNDFTAIIKCEHCEKETKLITGYDDDHYHNVVMPRLICSSCGKIRNDLFTQLSN